MTQSDAWYFGGIPVSGPKYIALGRRAWYSAFANHLTRQLQTKVYLCDFMDWVAEVDPEESLYFFIRSAERIDVHLKAIPTEDLRRATVGIGRSTANRAELRLSHMTGWEINQLFHHGHLDKAYWHTSDSMTASAAHAAMSGKVPRERILVGPNGLDNSLGARSMAPEELLAYYRDAGFVELQTLLIRMLAVSWARHLAFLDGYGTLVVIVHGQRSGRQTGALEISVHHKDLFIVQVHGSDGRVETWDRNVDARRLGTMVFDLIRRA